MATPAPGHGRDPTPARRPDGRPPARRRPRTANPVVRVAAVEPDLERRSADGHRRDRARRVQRRQRRRGCRRPRPSASARRAARPATGPRPPTGRPSRPGSSDRGPRRTGISRPRRPPRASGGTSPSRSTTRCSSRNVVWRSPAANAGSSRTAASRSRFVATPSIRVAVERVAEPGDRGRPVGRVRDHLGQQRVVERRHRRPGRDPGVHADARRGDLERPQHAGRRQEARRDVLGHDAQLHRAAVEPDVRLAEAERLARRDPQLLLDEVEPRDRLGHRVLDLEAGVDLEEEEPTGVVQQELGRPGVGVARGRREAEGRGPHRRPERRRHRGRRRLLDELLVAALDAALALAEVHERPVRVAQDLDLDVPRSLDEPLEEQPVVPERGRRLAPRGGDGLRELRRIADDAHPAPAPARARLDEQRVADGVGPRRELRVGRVARRGSRAAPGRRSPPRGPSRVPCRRGPASRPPAARSRRGPPRRRPRRSPRSRRGTRSPGGSRRRPSCARRR